MVRTAAIVLGLALLGTPALAAEPVQTKEQAQAEIWAKELSIYRERGRGNLGPYISNVAKDYLAWPPFAAVPTGVEALEQNQKKMATENKELLKMEFVSFAMNGDAAIIYYKTHRTRLPNGQPADERFEVTHSWVHQDGEWKVFGGMARAQPARP